MVANALIGAGSGILSGIAGVMGANASAFKQYKYNKKLQEQAAQLNYDYGQRSLMSSPSATRQGLEAAGYNPMLAVQNSTSGANAGWTSNSSVQAPDYIGAMSNAIDREKNIADIQNQTRQTESNIDLNDAAAEKNRADAAAQRLRNPFISDREKSEINQINADVTRINADTNLKKATIDNMEQRLKLDRELGFAGINADYSARIYGADRAYNASTYHSDTLKGIADTHSPSGKSQSFKNYTSGARDVMSGISDLIRGSRNETTTYEDFQNHGDGHYTRYTSSKNRRSRKH